LVVFQSAGVHALHAGGRLLPAPEAQWSLAPRFSVGQRDHSARVP